MKYWISKFTTWWSWFQRTKKGDQKPHLSWASVIAIMLAILMSIAVPCNRILFQLWFRAIILRFLGDRDEVLLQHLTHESKCIHIAYTIRMLIRSWRIWYYQALWLGGAGFREQKDVSEATPLMGSNDRHDLGDIDEHSLAYNRNFQLWFPRWQSQIA